MQHVSGGKKVLCLTSSFPRWKGDSTTPFVLELVEDLQQAGWEVDVLAPHASGCKKLEFFGNVKVERFSYAWPQRLQSICYQGGALVNLRKNKMNFLKLPAFVLAEFAATCSRLAIRRYDLLHSHWLLPQGFVGVLSSCITGVPHVVTIHGSDIFALQSGIYRPFKRFALRLADAVTVNSSATEQAVRQLYPQVKNLHRIPMGVDCDAHELEIGRKSSLQEGAGVATGPLIVFVGRIVEEKGVEDLLHAIPLIAREYPGIRALIVGEGQDRGDFERLARELGLEEKVAFTGWVDPSDIPRYLGEADVFVGPTRSEGQGLTFLEAMATGLPIIATRVGGIVDFVLHEQTGLLVDERSPKQIAEAVVRIHGSPELRKKLTEEGREMVQGFFSRRSTVKRFSDLFSELITAPV